MRQRKSSAALPKSIIDDWKKGSKVLEKASMQASQVEGGSGTALLGELQATATACTLTCVKSGQSNAAATRATASSRAAVRHARAMTHSGRQRANVE